MEGVKRPADRVTGSVSSYRDRLLEANPSTEKFQTNYPQKVYAKTRNLHKPKRGTEQLNESKSKTTTAEPKSKLYGTQRTAKEQTLGVQESNLRAEEHIQSLKEPKPEERDEGKWKYDAECAKVMRELESIKLEVSRLKLDMVSVLEEKKRANRERDSARSRAESYLGSAVGKLRREIEEINEKHVLVELARIEAVKEYDQVEAQRRREAERYAAKMEETRKKKQDTIQEMEDAAELEKKLTITESDVNILFSKLKQVNETNNATERKDTGINKVEPDIQEHDKPSDASLLQSVTEKLEAAKKELNSVREESFQFMTSMDIVRNEGKQVGDKLAKLRNKEKKSEMVIENLKSKLLRAKAKLEATSAAEDKVKSMASNVSVTLEQLKSETEEAKKEQVLISEETAVISAEIQKTETEIYLAEEHLQVAQQDLKTAKLAEATALENLKALSEETMRNRASTSRPNSRITISQLEYDYLIGHAAGAKEVADKKIAAAQAWIKALKASEKEMQIKSELLRRKGRELEVEEQQVTKRSMSLRRMAEDDLAKWRQSIETEGQKPGIALPRKAMNRSGRMTPARQGKARTFASPPVRGMPRSPFIVRRRRKVMPNLTNFFSRRSTKRHP